MQMFSHSIDFNNLTAHLTPIDEYRMVDDLYFLNGLSKRDLPIHINRNWHPKIKEIYNKYLSGEKDAPSYVRIPRTIYDLDFFVYEMEPIDDWEGYNQVFLEDLITEDKWLNLIYHTFKILKDNSKWELDVRSGPYMSMLPGEEMAFAHWAVLVKQDNNGTTYLVSRYNLDYLSDSLVKCNVVEKDRRRL
jgi:hypothetical protein